MADRRHEKRDSLTGFDRKRLRVTLRLAMGVKSNADMFAGRGQSWETTPSEGRQEAIRRNLLEKHLRDAKPSETRFIEVLQDRLADDGVLPAVKVDKQRLARERKKERPLHTSRSVQQNKHLSLASRVNRLANLHKELAADERVAAKTTDKYKTFEHFTLEID